MNKNLVTKRLTSGGWRIDFPCTGRAPQLYLEWLANYQHETRTSKYPFTFQIERIVPDDAEIDSDLFRVKGFRSKAEADECHGYIKENLQP